MHAGARRRDADCRPSHNLATAKTNNTYRTFCKPREHEEGSQPCMPAHRHPHSHWGRGAARAILMLFIGQAAGTVLPISYYEYVVLVHAHSSASIRCACVADLCKVHVFCDRIISTRLLLLQRYRCPMQHRRPHINVSRTKCEMRIIAVVSQQNRSAHRQSPLPWVH